MNRRRFLALGAALSLVGCISTGIPDETFEGRNNTGPGDSNSSESNSNEENPLIIEDPRIDEPPYDIAEPERPDGPDDETEWDADFLGTNMSREPSLQFERISNVIPIKEMGLTDLDGDDEYLATLLQSQSDVEEFFDLHVADPEAVDYLESINFDETVLVFIQSGYGSGSVTHRWVRVGSIDNGVHLHGYYTQPMMQTLDLTSRSSLVEIERPNNVDVARVSLTVAPDQRIHFNSTEGVVSP